MATAPKSITSAYIMVVDTARLMDTSEIFMGRSYLGPAAWADPAWAP